MTRQDRQVRRSRVRLQLLAQEMAERHHPVLYLGLMDALVDLVDHLPMRTAMEGSAYMIAEAAILLQDAHSDRNGQSLPEVDLATLRQERGL